MGRPESRSAVDQELATEGWTQAPTGQDLLQVAVEATRTKQLLNTSLRRLRGTGARGGRKNVTATVEKYKVGDSQAQGRVAELAGGIMSAMIDSSLRSSSAARPAFTRVDVARSECQASGMVLVASSVRTRADHDSMVPYEGLLRILSQFRFLRLGVHEFVPSIRAGIKPAQNSIRFAIWALGKSD